MHRSREITDLQSNHRNYSLPEAAPGGFLWKKDKIRIDG